MTAPSNQPQDVFTRIYNTRAWGGKPGSSASRASASGPGSSLQATQLVRPYLEQFVRKYQIKHILDLPCGDFFWMKLVDFGNTVYIGADIVPDIIDANRKQYPSKPFMVLDLLQDPLPPCELIFCRDCLVHLTNNDILKAISNMRASGIKYLMTTTFPPLLVTNTDLTQRGKWRPLNLELPPFSFPPPLS